MRNRCGLLISLSLLLIAPLLTACQPVRGLPPLMLMLTKPDDRAGLRWEGRDLALDLHSPGGIGGVRLSWRDNLAGSVSLGELLDGGSLVLRLPLRGLEGLHVWGSAGEASLSVLSSPPYTVRSEGGAAGSAGGVTGITIERQEDGFSVRLDRPWLEGGSLAVDWVDFYR